MAVEKIERNIGLDILRVIACYMVIQIHTGEFYYIGNLGQTLNTGDSHWVGLYNSICRISVPLFVMISGFFMFPIVDNQQFFKKRFSRVLIPFVIWCILYAFYHYFRGEATLHNVFNNILKIPINYGVQIGHLWFVYMLLGLYLFAPVISPWIQSASRRAMEYYLVLWAVAISLPYIHLWFAEIWGEAYWNNTPMLYYFSGFFGYIVLATYIRRFLMEDKPWNYIAGIVLIVAGYSFTASVFLSRLQTEKIVSKLELSWGFETINVAMMTLGAFLILKNYSIKGNSRLKALIIDISAKSYGIYLAHIMVLNAYYAFINPHMNTAAIKIPVIALCTFVTTYVAIKLVSYLPKSKWLIG